jgi:arabinan endo-1,5-alpha-L-arabinosidase
MGDYSFAGTGIAYVSPGHSSAFHKDDTDQYFLFFHTRFLGRGEQHEVRVHEIFFNDAGWPVVAPLRYVERFDDDNPGATPEELAAVSADDVPGTYQYVNHDKDISGTLKTSANIELESGGGISGAVTGSWIYTESTRAITLILDSVSYQGVVSRQWNQSRDRFEATFTVLSADGTAVWGIKAD